MPVPYSTCKGLCLDKIATPLYPFFVALYQKLYLKPMDSNSEIFICSYNEFISCKQTISGSSLISHATKPLFIAALTPLTL